MVGREELEVLGLVVRDVEMTFKIKSVSLPGPAMWQFRGNNFLIHRSCEGVLWGGGGDDIQDGGMIENVGIGGFRGRERVGKGHDISNSKVFSCKVGLNVSSGVSSLPILLIDAQLQCEAVWSVAEHTWANT